MEGLDGVRRIYGFTPVGGNAKGRLFITAGRSSESVFADPNKDLRRFLLLAALGVVLALALSYVVTKLLLGRWTEAVVSAARRFGAGDLTARAPVPHGLGELTDVAQRAQRRRRGHRTPPGRADAPAGRARGGRGGDAPPDRGRHP